MLAAGCRRICVPHVVGVVRGVAAPPLRTQQSCPNASGMLLITRRGYAHKRSPLRSKSSTDIAPSKVAQVSRLGVNAFWYFSVAGVIGAGCTLLYSGDMLRPSEEEKFMVVDNEVRHRAYDKKATIYDDEIGWSEIFMGLLLLRRYIVGQAEGKVLEVAVGTGRNFQYYYRPAVSELHCVDCSRPMIEVSKERAKECRGIKYMFLEGNAEALPVGDNEYDTVIDTFGLCSFDKPVTAVREMMRVCKPGGKVLLMEHGKPDSDGKLTQMLGASAAKHAKEWGCWWNRNIIKILFIAGMDPRDYTLSTYHFGTTKVIQWTKPLGEASVSEPQL